MTQIFNFCYCHLKFHLTYTNDQWFSETLLKLNINWLHYMRLNFCLRYNIF